MSTVVHASNRVIDPRESGAVAGGLDNTLKSIPEGVDHVVRFGWSGKTVPDRDYNFENPNEHLDIFDKHSPDGRVMSFALLDLPERAQKNHYGDVSTGDLWSTLHHRADRTSVNGGKTLEYMRKARENYDVENEIFAKALGSFIQPSWTIVTHDFHLLRFAHHLKNQGIMNENGLMMHVPLLNQAVLDDPALDPETATFVGDLLRNHLFDFDMVGFQAPWDINNLQTILKTGQPPLQLDAYETGTLYNERGQSLHVGVFPATGDSALNKQKLAEFRKLDMTGAFLRSSLGRRPLDMVGMDRLDYTKALPLRLEALRSCIEDFGADPQKIHLLQAAPAGRAGVFGYAEEEASYTCLYQELRDRYGNVVSTPYGPNGKPVPVEQGLMFAAYERARVAIFASKRDGMHLGLGEFTDCQIPEDPGAIVATHTMGAAHLYRNAAVLVNPDVADIARGMMIARNMPRDERIYRYNEALEVNQSNTNQRWVTALVEETRRGAERRTPIQPNDMTHQYPQAAQ